MKNFSKAVERYLAQLGQTHSAEYITAIAQQAEMLATARGDSFVLLRHIFDARVVELASSVRQSERRRKKKRETE